MQTGLKALKALVLFQGTATQTSHRKAEPGCGAAACQRSSFRAGIAKHRIPQGKRRKPGLIGNKRDTARERGKEGTSVASSPGSRKQGAPRCCSAHGTCEASYRQINTVLAKNWNYTAVWSPPGLASPGCVSSAGSCCLLWKQRHPEHVPMAPAPTETSSTRRKQTHPQHFTYGSFKKGYLGSWGSKRRHVGTPGEFRVQQEGYTTICWKFHFIPFTAEHLSFGNSDGSAEAALAGSLCPVMCRRDRPSEYCWVYPGTS